MSEPSSNPPSILSTLGLDLIRILTPVSCCMLIVVLLVTALSSPSNSPQILTSSIATIAYSESPSDTLWTKLKGAVFNSIIFVAILTLVTFLLFTLFYFRFTGFLKSYMGFSSFIVVAFLGGEICLLLLDRFRFPIDVVSFLVMLVNFAAVGTMAVFSQKMPISVTQGYLVMIGVLVAYCFTMLPEWTTWAMLVAMALYDLAAVLLPVGPLRLLVELAIERDEEIPALVYEARPVESISNHRRRLWRERSSGSSLVSNSVAPVLNSISLDARQNPSCTSDLSTDTRDSVADHSSDLMLQDTRLVVDVENSELRAPLVNRQSEEEEEEGLDGIGLSSSGAIKLGLGDFIFYSVLVGRAALYDYMTVYACYLAIIAGLGITLTLLAFYRKALPALPVSIMLGVLFYLLTRTLLEVFVVQCSINLLMF